LSNGSTVFVASGLDAGAGSSSYIISDVSDHFADPGDYTIFLDFTPAASQVADAWMFTFSNVSDTGNMDVSTLRADNSYDWVRQRSGVPNINQGGPAESPVTNRHRVAYYVSGTNGNRMAVNGAYVAAETNQLYPLGGGAWDFHLFRQPGLPASGLFNGVMHEVRVYDGHVGDGDFGNKDGWILALSNGEVEETPGSGGPPGGGGAGGSGGSGSSGPGPGTAASLNGKGNATPRVSGLIRRQGGHQVMMPPSVQSQWRRRGMYIPGVGKK
jgi:hypothetical protein